MLQFFLSAANAVAVAVSPVAATWTAPTPTVRITTAPASVSAAWTSASLATVITTKPAAIAAAWSAITPGFGAVAVSPVSAAWSAVAPSTRLTIAPGAVASSWSAALPASVICTSPAVLTAAWTAVAPNIAGLGGYNVYKRLLPDAESVFVAFVPAGTEEYTATGFSAGSEQWFHVKAVSQCDVEDDEPVRLRRVAFDSLGNLILAVPNAPIGLSLECGAAGAITASFSYITNNQEAEPVRFNVYVATGSSDFNFASPTAQVTYTQRYRYSASLGTFADLTTVRVIVRAEAAGPAEEKNLNEVTAIADAAAPSPALALEVEVTAS